MYSLNEVQNYCKSKGKNRLILDTNLLLLLLIGACDKNFLPKHDCTKKYTTKDYDLLIDLLRYFKSEIILTPHILAEVSDLSRRDIKEPRLAYYFACLIEKLKNFKEEHISLEQLLDLKVSLLSAYGFPDMSVFEAARKTGAVVMTDDLALSAYVITSSMPAVSFSAVQAASLLSS